MGYGEGAEMMGKRMEGMGDMGNVGPRGDMGEELGRTGGSNDDANDQHPGSPTQLAQE